MPDFSGVKRGDRIRATYEFDVESGIPYFGVDYLVEVEVIKPPFTFPAATNSIINGLDDRNLVRTSSGKWRDVENGLVYDEKGLGSGNFTIVFDAGANNG